MALEPCRPTTSVPGSAAQPATPGRSGQVQAGDAAAAAPGATPGRTASRTSRAPARSVTQLTFVAGSGQTSPGECSPLPTIGEPAGVPGAGRPKGSMRSSLPASEVGEVAAAG